MTDETIETPYSRGERLEPSLQINPESIHVWPGPSYLEDQFKHFGKVHFNDQGENEVVTAWVAVDQDGNRTLHVFDHSRSNTHEIDLEA